MIKLLIVDDENGLSEYLRDFFGPKGYQVSIAGSAQEALAFVEREMPELVLLDINMPDINGLEVLRYIKKTSAQSKVIMVTVSDDADTREKAKSLGADDFVKKPFTTDYLEDVDMIQEEMERIVGKSIGYYKIYYENGRLKEEGYQKNGQPVGVIKKYDDAGELLEWGVSNGKNYSYIGKRE
jgi:CheY-like chemotaxis protein